MELNKHLFNQVSNHPFFQGVEKDEALKLLDQCTRQSYQSMEKIYHANKQREGLLLLLSGIAEVYVESTHGRQEVLEIIQVGEFIGFSRLADFLGFAQKETDTMVEVRAIEGVEALHIPFDVIKKRWNDQNVHDYFLTKVAVRLKDIYMSLAEQIKLSRQFTDHDPIVLRVQDIMSAPVISVQKMSSIKEVADMMMSNRTSSVIVLDHEKLIGIITERDLVERFIANGAHPSSDSILAENIMTKQPLTISRFSYYYDALSTLLLNGIKHLPVVDGAKVVGIVTLSDLLRKKNENMMRTIKAIETADEQTLAQIKPALYEVLHTFINGSIPTLDMLDMMTKLNDRIVTRCIDLAIQSLNTATPCPFCFYQMGSSGRGEQFLLTDQDHFIVYGNSSAEAYFTRLSEEIVRLLELAGYERCKGKMMSNDKKWRGNLTTWEDRLRGWTIQSTNQNLLLVQNFFSYRFVYGDSTLHKKFEQNLLQQLKRGKILLHRLIEVERENQIPSLDHPVRSLFGLHKKQIDLKKEVLFPFHHSLQILSLLHGIPSGTTIERIDRLVGKHALSVDFGKDLKIAIEELLKIYVTYKWKQHINQLPSSSVLEFTHLTTRDKDELMLSLKTLRELQQIVYSKI